MLKKLKDFFQNKVHAPIINLIKKIKPLIKKYNIGNFIARYSILIGLTIICLYGLAFKHEAIWTIFYAVLAETLALWLSNIGIFAFTQMNFIKELKNGSTDLQKIGYYIILGSIVLAVHIVIGLSFYGLFLATNSTT